MGHVRKSKRKPRKHRIGAYGSKRPKYRTRVVPKKKRAKLDAWSPGIMRALFDVEQF